MEVKIDMEVIVEVEGKKLFLSIEDAKELRDELTKKLLDFN